MAARRKRGNTSFIQVLQETAGHLGGICTYERRLVGHGGQDVIQDEQQDRDGQQHSDLEAQFLSSVVSDEERGQVQGQEEDDGQQEVDDVEEGPPLHGELRKKVRTRWTKAILFTAPVCTTRCNLQTRSP